MVRQPSVLGIVHSEGLLLAGLNGTMHLDRAVVGSKHAADGKKGLAVANVVCVGGVEIAFRGAEVVDRVQHVGLSRTVFAHKSIESG